jgi:hypothetical protein
MLKKKIYKKFKAAEIIVMHFNINIFILFILIKILCLK